MEHMPVSPDKPAPYRLVGAGGTITFHTTYYHLDHLGSPRILTDGSGIRVQGQHFLPFGEEMPIEAGLNSRKFTGHERDSETGLDYMVARYYSSSLGRFMAADPGDDTELENPQTWNKYTYVRNNPLSFFDPDGEATEVHSQTVTYATTGSTAAEAMKNAGASHPDGFAGHTAFTISVTNVESVEAGSSDTGTAVSVPTDVTISVDITTSLPDWKAPADAAPGEQGKFDQAKADLQKHEQGHAKIAVQGGKNLEKTAKGLVGTGQGMNQAQAKANAKADLNGKTKEARKKETEKTKQREKAYDKQTDHGRKKP